MTKQDAERRARGVRRGGLVRKTAYLYEDEAALLEREAERRRISESELIRQAVRRELGVEL